jgi:hypothetical protein
MEYSGPVQSITAACLCLSWCALLLYAGKDHSKVLDEHVSTVMDKAKQVSAQVRGAPSSLRQAWLSQPKLQQQDGVSHTDSTGSKRGKFLWHPEALLSLSSSAYGSTSTSASDAWFKLLPVSAYMCHASSECVSEQQQQLQLEHAAAGAVGASLACSALCQLWLS